MGLAHILIGSWVQIPAQCASEIQKEYNTKSLPLWIIIVQFEALEDEKIKLEKGLVTSYVWKGRGFESRHWLLEGCRWIIATSVYCSESL